MSNLSEACQRPHAAKYISVILQYVIPSISSILECQEENTSQF